MTMGWETAKDLSKKHAESGGLFVQLKDHGDKIAGVFCGEPYTTSPRKDLSGLGRDIIAGHTTFDASLALVHKGDIGKSLRVAAYVHDLFHGGNRITNTLDAGVFYFGAVNPNREMGVEATFQF